MILNLWVGAVTPTSAWVRGKVTGASIRVAVDTDPSLSVPTFYGPVVPTGTGIASVLVTGLAPDTQYYFAMEDGTLDEDWAGSFRTHPPLGEPANYMFTAASCAGHIEGGYTTNHVSNHPVFDTIRSLNPLFNALLGDGHYRNIDINSPALFDAAYDDMITFNGLGHTARAGLLYRNAGLVYLYDDHDFAGNDSDGTSPAADAAVQVYRDRVPHYPLPDVDAIYHSFGVGRVLYIASDVRFDRSPNSDPDGPSKTMLGQLQKLWMEGVLTSPGFDARYLIWLMPSQWMGTGNDTWASFVTERTEMVQLFGDTGWLDRMCVVSGDVHALAIDTGGGNAWGGFPVFQFASLDGEGGGVQNHYDTGPTQPGRNQYGTMGVHDCGAGLTITGTGWIGSTEWRSHTALVPLSPGGSLVTMPAAKRHQQTANEDGITNIDWAPGANICGVSFTAPPSGRATISWAARMESNTGNGVLVSVEVREGGTIGAGNVFAAPSNDYAIETAEVVNQNVQFSNFRPLSGLVPGATYNARLVHKVTAGSADLFSRQIKYTPDH